MAKESVQQAPGLMFSNSREPAILVENVGKEYVIGKYEKGNQTFREMIVSSISSPFTRLRRLKGHVPDSERIWALKDVSFEIMPGEVVGVIGRNGAGKSTLLKILSRITSPTSGRVKLRGRVGSLLEVGTGFHPELSGRENIYLNGAILGMAKREIESKFDEIVAFAEIDQFLDTPVKRYSSGMYVRLAFSVAAHLEPEILLVDEVLAVGDIAFQRKCLGKMENVSRTGRTVILVSHQLQAIQAITKRCILIDKGRVSLAGDTNEVMKKYQSFLGKEQIIEDRSYLKKEFSIRRVSFLNSKNNLVDMIERGEELTVQMLLESNTLLKNIDISISVRNGEGLELFSNTWTDDNHPLELVKGKRMVMAEIPTRFLKMGQYWLTLCVTRNDRDIIEMIRGVEMPFVGMASSEDPEKESHRWGVVRLPVRWRSIEND